MKRTISAKAKKSTSGHFHPNMIYYKEAKTLIRKAENYPMKFLRQTRGHFPGTIKLYYIFMLSFILLAFTGCYGHSAPSQTDTGQIDPASEIRLEVNENQETFLTGQKKNKETFQILLSDYNTVLLNQTEFCDLTGDSRMELCVGLDIGNNIISDLNELYVFDSVTLELLFPTEDVTTVYRSEIISLAEEGFPEYAIDYESFTKFHTISFPEERSLIGWMDGRFSTLHYQKKLMALDTEHFTAVFLEDYFPYERNSTLNLSVETIWDIEKDIPGKTLQTITVNLNQETDWDLIHQKIKDNSLIYFEDRNKNGYPDLIIQPYGKALHDFEEIIYEWNSTQKLFLKMQ